MIMDGILYLTNCKSCLINIPIKPEADESQFCSSFFTFCLIYIRKRAACLLIYKYFTLVTFSFDETDPFSAPCQGNVTNSSFFTGLTLPHIFQHFTR